MAVNTYETVFVAEPEIPAEQVDQLITKIKETVASHHGSVTSEDRWGRRRLAYSIHGHREGFYSVLTFTAEPTVISAIEHLYNVTDSVLRHLTIRHIEKHKKFAPRKERPAGASDGHRPPSRYGSSSRPRPDVSARSASPALPANPAAPETASPATVPVAKPETPPPQGEKS